MRRGLAFAFAVSCLCLVSAGCNRLGGGAANQNSSLGGITPGGTPPPANGKKRVFITSTTYTGFLGGLSAADSICNSRATAGDLGGTWVAWLSDGQTNAINRVNDVGPWYLVDASTMVFPNKASITASGPAVPINITETLSAPTVSNVWTGTAAATGNASANSCQSWTTSSNRTTGDIGSVGTGATWTQNSFLTCSLAAALYCFEQ